MGGVEIGQYEAFLSTYTKARCGSYQCGGISLQLPLNPGVVLDWMNRMPV